MIKSLKHKLLFIFASFFLNSIKPYNQHRFSKNIDYGKFKTTRIDPCFESDSWLLGQAAFNHAPELIPFFLWLRNTYRLNTAIETGTYSGATTSIFALLFEKVHTIEINQQYYEISKRNLKEFENIRTHLGDSVETLKKILPAMQGERILFYLDAHWQNYFPLHDELNTIGKTHRDNCIIVIDDFRVPGRYDIPFDSYGQLSCSLASIGKVLKTVYSEYNYYYLIPRDVKSKAKFVCIPSKWDRKIFT